MRYLFPLMICSMMLFFTASCFADVTAEDITQAIDINNLEHPYMLFSRDSLPEIRQRIADDRECGDIFDRLSAEANRYLYTPVEPFVQGEEEDFYSGRLSYLRSHRKAAETLAFVYVISGENKYAEKAFEFADSICAVSDWVNGYHQFPVIYTRVWPWNVPDDQVSFSVDLEAAHTSFTLALVYDWLYDAMGKAERDRIRGALLEKLITRVRGNYEFHWWATAYRCNWCTVVNSALGISALVLIKENPFLTDVVAESYNRISRTLDEVGVNGGWQEGCSYWNYMLRTSMEFADVLKRTSSGKYDIFKHPAIQNNPVSFALYTHIPPNKSVNFGDASGSQIGQTSYLNRLISETGSREAAWYRNNKFGAGNSYLDILWPRNDDQGVLPKTVSRHFRTIGWAMLRNSIDNPEDVTIAAKAGHHDDPHHGHLDCGNFILYWRGEGFIAETGRGSYDERYFQESRWEFPQASAEGHNVVLVNGEDQIPAKHKDEPWLDGIGGEILRFESGEKRDYVLIDAGGAYPAVEMKGWRRHIVFDKPDVTVVLDEIAAVPGSEISVRYHSEVDQKINGQYLTLDGEKGDMALIPACVNGFSFRQGKHPVMAASGLTLKRAQFRWEPFCDVVIKADNSSTTVLTIILPSDSTKQTEAVVESLKYSENNSHEYTVEFDYGGRDYEYHFYPADDGLVFKY